LCLNTRLIVNKNYEIFIIFIEINVSVCLLWAHHVMTSIILHTRNLTVNKKSVTQLVFRFQLIFFFAFWGAEKHVFHIVPFRPTRYVINSIKCLEISSSLTNWNKVKNDIYVRSKFQLCLLEIPIFINKLMCQSSLIISFSFVFCEFNRVAG
jgi:hypothetical protein